ncbi:MAG: hypothetical protein ACT4P7_08255 [Gemmatimonadaceae bacterium]
MPTLKDTRVAFIEQVQRYLSHAGEQRRFTEVLDYFIDWSQKRPLLLTHRETDDDLDTVRFTRLSDGMGLWAASPRRADGAKFEVLPRPRKKLNIDVREDALTVLRSISREPLTDESPLQVSFAALKGNGGRELLAGLMDRILQAAPVPPPARSVGVV